MDFLILLNAIFYLVSISFVIKFCKWLAGYYSTYNRFKNLKHIPILPFIGSVHLIESRNSKFYCKI